ncbi:hypothetical protein FM112_11150 [Gulosibacter sp. 10]|nr:hypothetical protein FM112_11150 [Gulosibacter sp. 10]
MVLPHVGPFEKTHTDDSQCSPFWSGARHAGAPAWRASAGLRRETHRGCAHREDARTRGAFRRVDGHR